MADEYVEFEVDVADKASPKLTRLEKNIGKVGAAVDRASSNFVGMIKQSAMMAGFFALGPAIAGAKHYIDHLDRISDLTGIAADRVGGISNALQGAGVSAEGVDNVFDRLVKKGAQVAEGNKALITLGKKYGITIKEGPEEALLGVSKLLEKGKINAGGMQRILGVSSDDAADLAEALAQGPEKLKQQFDELTKKNAAFSEEAMNGMAEYKHASAKIGEAWNRMTAGVLIKFAPALTKLAEKFEHSIEGWTEGAEKFGNFLVKHMDTIISMAKTYAKIMFANVALQKLGMGGIMGVAGKGARGARAISGGVSAFAGALSIGAGKGAMITMAQSAFGVVGKIVGSLMRLGPIGVAIGIMVGAVKALGENFNGIGTRLRATFGGIFDTVVRIGAKIAGLFGSDGPLGKFMGGVGYAFLEVVEKIGQVIGFILNMVEKIIGMIPDVFKSVGGDMFKTPEQLAVEGRASEEEAAYKRGLAKIAPAPKLDKMTGAQGPVINQDFRGSRFDIKQAFAEGFDPDRIATAFANDLSSIGERKLQSGFSPLFTVR